MTTMTTRVRSLMALEILVVDDEADIRELVSGVLEDEGYAVRTAADSTAALEAIEERRPSMVLLDVWLQGSRLDGLQLLAGDQAPRSDHAGADDLGPRQSRHRGRRDPAKGRSTSSRSRSRPSGCSISSTARPRPSGCGARMRRCASRSARRTSCTAARSRSTPSARR